MKEQWHCGGIKGQKNHGMSNKTLSNLLVQPSLCFSFSLGTALWMWTPMMAAAPTCCWHRVSCHQLLCPTPTQAAGQAEVQPGISHSTAASLGVTSTKWNGKQGPSRAIQCQHPSIFNAVSPRKPDFESNVSWNWCCCDAVKIFSEMGFVAAKYPSSPPRQDTTTPLHNLC